jgi:hypothetical protein
MVYVINMRERTERKEKMTTLMKKIGITEYEFIEPVKITDETIPAEYMKNRMNKGNTSLNLTILTKIYPKVQQKEKRDFIVMEDDIMTMMPEEKVKTYISELLREVPKDWNMIYLEYCLEMCSFGETVTNTKKLKKAFKPYCAAAILFRYNTIDSVKKCIETKKQPLSFTYTSCIREKDIIAYVAHPPVFAQDVLMQGDIDHTASPFGIHFYLNRILKMYDNTTDTTVSKPRLPHCIDSRETLTYIRWGNVGGILFGFIILLGIYRYFVTKNRKGIILRNKK